MIIEITEQELNDIFKDKILDYLKTQLNNTDLEYWIRNEMHKIISKEIIDGVIKRDFPAEKITKIMRTALRDYVYSKFEE